MHRWIRLSTQHIPRSAIALVHACRNSKLKSSVTFEPLFIQIGLTLLDGGYILSSYIRGMGLYSKHILCSPFDLKGSPRLTAVETGKVRTAIVRLLPRSQTPLSRPKYFLCRNPIEEKYNHAFRNAFSVPIVNRDAVYRFGCVCPVRSRLNYGYCFGSDRRSDRRCDC